MEKCALTCQIYVGIIVDMYLKLFLAEAFFSSKCNNIVWRPGFARTHWGSLQRSPDHLAGLSEEAYFYGDEVEG